MSRRSPLRVGVYLADLRRSKNDSHGIVNHAVGLVSALPDHLGPGERLVLLYGRELASELTGPLGHPAVEGIEVPSPRSTVERLRTDHLTARRWMREARLDVAHFPKGFIPIHPPPSTRVVATVHDDIPIRRQKSTPVWSRGGLKAAYFAHAVRHTLHRADQVITVSSFSRNALIGHVPAVAARLRVIGNGISVPLLDPVPIRLKRPILVLFGSPFRHKRSPEGIRWARRFLDRDERFSLIVTGSLCPAGETAARHPRIVLKPGVMTGPELATLLRDAAALLFPSVLEGFGLPPVEAACLGTPSVWAGASALLDVMGDAPGRFRPDDGESFAAALDEVLTLDDAAIGRLAARFRDRYSWSRFAPLTMQTYRDVVSASHRQLTR